MTSKWIAGALALAASVSGIAAGVAPASAVEGDLTSDLVGWWKLDETSGTVAADSSGNGRNGAVAGGSSSRTLVSLLGHHIHRPTSRLSAVTSTDRTTRVSSRTPKATAKPISANATSGRLASAANVPASTMPAEVITPPVAASPIVAPRRVPCCCASSRTRVIRKML